MIDLCSSFFKMPLFKASWYIFAFTWEGQQYTWKTMSQSFTENPFYLSQNFKANLADIIFL